MSEKHTTTTATDLSNRTINRYSVQHPMRHERLLGADELDLSGLLDVAVVYDETRKRKAILCRDRVSGAYALRYGGLLRSIGNREGAALEREAAMLLRRTHLPDGTLLKQQWCIQLSSELHRFVIHHGGASFVRSLIDQARRDAAARGLWPNVTDDDTTMLLEYPRRRK